ADQLLGNPLMLQIAASQDSLAGSDLLSSRNSLLNVVVERERLHTVREWRNAKIQEFLIPTLLQLTALICLMGGASVSQIMRIVDECDAFHLLSRAMNVSQILEALKPVLRGDGDATVRAIEPDLVGDLFVARSNLAAAPVSFVIGFDPYTIGGHL